MFRQVVGSDADFVHAATVVESETTLSGLMLAVVEAKASYKAPCDDL